MCMCACWACACLAQGLKQAFTKACGAILLTWFGEPHSNIHTSSFRGLREPHTVIIRSPSGLIGCGKKIAQSDQGYCFWQTGRTRRLWANHAKPCACFGARGADHGLAWRGSMDPFLLGAHNGPEARHKFCQFADVACHSANHGYPAMGGFLLN